MKERKKYNIIFSWGNPRSDEREHFTRVPFVLVERLKNQWNDMISVRMPEA